MSRSDARYYHRRSDAKRGHGYAKDTDPRQVRFERVDRRNLLTSLKLRDMSLETELELEDLT